VGFADYHLSAPLAAALQALGWQDTDRLVRETAPSAARGHSLLVTTPPSARYAVPTLAGLFSRCAAGGPITLLACPESSLHEWAAAVAPLAQAAGLSFHMAAGASRAARRTKAGGADVLVAPPRVLLALQRRSALKIEPEAPPQLVLAWPELFEPEDDLEPLMQDLPKTAQHILITTDPNAVQSLVQRHLWKAPAFGDAPRRLTDAVCKRVRTVVVPWDQRAAAIPALLEVLDPATVAIWVADPATEVALGARIRCEIPEASTVSGDAPPADLIVAYDLPSAERLEQLAAAGSVVLMVPPLAAPYVGRMAPGHGSLRLPGVLEAKKSEAATRRTGIAQAIEAGPPGGALLALAPLFERYEPTAVAAALYQLWTQPGERAPVPAPAAPAQPFGDIPATAKLWVGIGKKDNVTANDLVATLTREVRVDRADIGKIDIRELYTLVELPARDIERIGRAVNGLTIKKRRVTARVDRGRAGRTGGPSRRAD